MFNDNENSITFLITGSTKNILLKVYFLISIVFIIADFLRKHTDVYLKTDNRADSVRSRQN